MTQMAALACLGASEFAALSQTVKSTLISQDCRYFSSKTPPSRNKPPIIAERTLFVCNVGRHESANDDTRVLTAGDMKDVAGDLFVMAIAEEYIVGECGIRCRTQIGAHRSTRMTLRSLPWTIGVITIRSRQLVRVIVADCICEAPANTRTATLP